MAKNLVIEIRDFFSLREIIGDLDERIAQYTSMKEEYSRELGSYLRRSEERYGKEDWFEKLSMNNLKGEKDQKKSMKNRGKASSSCWISYKGLTLSSTEQGEMEILFEAIEALEKKVDKLIETKKAVEELVNVGLSENLRYRIYIRDGVPEKMVLRPREKGAERFTLNMVFSKIS